MELLELMTNLVNPPPLLKKGIENEYGVSIAILTLLFCLVLTYCIRRKQRPTQQAVKGLLEIDEQVQEIVQKKCACAVEDEGPIMNDVKATGDGIVAVEEDTKKLNTEVLCDAMYPGLVALFHKNKTGALIGFKCNEEETMQNELFREFTTKMVKELYQYSIKTHLACPWNGTSVSHTTIHQLGRIKDKEGVSLSKHCEEISKILNDEIVPFASKYVSAPTCALLNSYMYPDGIKYNNCKVGLYGCIFTSYTIIDDKDERMIIKHLPEASTKVSRLIMDSDHSLCIKCPQDLFLLTKVNGVEIDEFAEKNNIRIEVGHRMVVFRPKDQTYPTIKKAKKEEDSAAGDKPFDGIGSN